MSFNLIKSIEENINNSKEKITIRKILIPFKEEIQSAIDSGYNVKEIYEGFTSKKIISCSYRQFWNVVHNFFPDYEGKNKSKSTLEKPSSQRNKNDSNINKKNLNNINTEKPIHHEIHIQKGAPPEERWHHDSNEPKPYHKHKAIMTDEDRKRLI